MRSTCWILAALLVWLASAACGPPAPEDRARSRRSLLLVTLDTLRADRTGAYGDPHARTPAIDRLAREGVLFAEAVCQAPLTLPSHASILTGVPPRTHGLRDNGGARLPDGLWTLAASLRSVGYRTGAFVSAAPLQPRFGLDRGFDRYDAELPRTGSRFAYAERRGDHTAAAAIAWIRDGAPAAPFFAWVHLFDPHAPYTPPSPFDAWLDGDPYAGEVAFADACLEKILRTVDRLGESDRPVVAVLADHGEGLGDHGEASHAVYVWETTLRIPWLVKAPGIASAGCVVEDTVETLDVAPTLVSLLAIPTPAPLPGRDLTPVLSGSRTGPRGPVASPSLSESAYGFLQFGWSPLYSIRQGSWKLIRAGGRDRLFHLADDPGEAHDLAGVRNDVAESLRAALCRRFDEAPEPLEAEAELADLRALGYFSGTGAGVAIPPPCPPEKSDLPDPLDRADLLAGILEVEARASEGAPASALEAIGPLIVHDPANPTLRFLEAELLRTLGRASGEGRERLYARALESARQALRLRPGETRSSELAMQLCLLLGKFEECREIASRVRFPSAGFLFLRANLRSLDGSPERDLDAAIDDLETALRLDPELASARALLEQLRARRGTDVDGRK